MFQRRTHRRLVLIKLAAIGDVAMASRAIAEFAARYEASFELHWITDEALAPLARRLLSPDFSGVHLSAKFHSIDSKRLFQGTRSEKLCQAYQLMRLISSIDPSHVVVLHRDWRYRLVSRLAFTGRLISLPRHRTHEMEAHVRCLERVAWSMRLKRRPATRRRGHRVEPSGLIGVLVGGAQNQKVTYEEKRWPYLGRLIELILRNSAKRIVLFGGPNDMVAAQLLVANASRPERIDNLVNHNQLDELPAQLAKLDAFVSIDSGPAHIAAAVMMSPHQRIVSLFGPTDPLVWAPQAGGEARMSLLYKAKDCSPCYHDDGLFVSCAFKQTRFQHCMTDITPEEVYAALCD